jgi:hypothetical protein
MPVPAKKGGRGGTIALVAATFVAVAGMAFAGGRLSAPTAAAGNGQNGPFNRFGPGASFAPGASFVPGGGPGGGGRLTLGGTTLRGEVTAITTDSITVELDDGTSLTIPLNSATTYHQAAAADAGSVSVGDKVAVEPGAPSISANASPGTGIQFGPAVDVTVTAN